MKLVNLNDLKNTTTVADATPVEFAVATHGIVRESQVDVLFMMAPLMNDDGIIQSESDRRLIRIKVWSKKRPGLFSFTDIKCAGRSRDEMARACEFAAPALGERQEILYGDVHELSVLSKKAKEHFNELCAHLERENALSGS
jgi:hypothetical protein